jgi:nucleoside-diphosphate-sugar epimerase
MTKKKKIFIAGHKGLVGSALSSTFKAAGYCDIKKQSINFSRMKDLIGFSLLRQKLVVFMVTLHIQ